MVFGFGTVGFSLREVVSAQEVLDETPKSKFMLPGCKSAQQSFAFSGTLCPQSRTLEGLIFQILVSLEKQRR